MAHKQRPAVLYGGTDEAMINAIAKTLGVTTPTTNNRQMLSDMADALGYAPTGDTDSQDGDPPHFIQHQDPLPPHPDDWQPIPGADVSWNMIGVPSGDFNPASKPSNTVVGLYSGTTALFTTEDKVPVPLDHGSQ